MRGRGIEGRNHAGAGNWVDEDLNELEWNLDMCAGCVQYVYSGQSTFGRWKTWSSHVKTRIFNSHGTCNDTEIQAVLIVLLLNSHLLCLKLLSTDSHVPSVCSKAP